MRRCRRYSVTEGSAFCLTGAARAHVDQVASFGLAVRTVNSVPREIATERTGSVVEFCEKNHPFG